MVRAIRRLKKLGVWEIGIPLYYFFFLQSMRFDVHPCEINEHLSLMRDLQLIHPDKYFNFEKCLQVNIYWTCMYTCTCKGSFKPSLTNSFLRCNLKSKSSGVLTSALMSWTQATCRNNKQRSNLQSTLWTIV